MMGARSDHVPTCKTIDLLVRLSRAPVPENKTSVPWENATSPSSPCSSWSGWNNICPVVVACAVARNRIVARAFIAKAVFQIDTTRALSAWPTTGRYAVCAAGRVSARCPAKRPSRAFAEFAEGASEPPTRGADHGHHAGSVGRSRRDATAIEGREKATPKPQQPAKPKRKRGRPRKGEERPKEPSRLERQQEMTLPEMLADLRRAVLSAPSATPRAIRNPGSATSCISTRPTVGFRSVVS